MPNETPTRRRLTLIFGAAVLAFSAWAAVDWYRVRPAAALRQATYVGRASCVECHRPQAEAFAGSDHDRAMEPATDSTVLGDFNNATFTRHDETTRFFRDGKRFMVNAEGPDGLYHDYEIEWTFGVRPLQQYMVRFPDGRVQVLRVSWDVLRKRWFYVAPPDAQDDRIAAGDPLHWTGLSQNWNTMCAECHSTDYHKNFNLADNTYHSEYNEIDVSCEACHGPGSLHVELAQEGSLFWDRNVGYGLTNSLKTASNVQQMETCAPCHSRRTMVHESYRPGESFYDNFEPLLLYNGLYHSDGQIADEVYEFGSFTQSKMYHKGVRCSDCHDPHSLKLKHPGNQLCGQCHQPGQYDGPMHHHHVAAADNAPETQCVTCHMPTATYMGVDVRRDHSFRVPRPDLTASLGTPNACGRCHAKPTEDAAWAAETVKRWYGPNRPDDPHYAAALDAAQRGDPQGEALLQSQLQRAALPDLVRATAVSLLSRYPTPASDRLQREALKHPSPAVRAAAVRALAEDAPERMLAHQQLRLDAQDPSDPLRQRQAAAELDRYVPTRLVGDVEPLLRDPVRAVRYAAAARLIAVAPALEQSQYQAVLDRAIQEFKEPQQLHLDRADAHMSLGSLNEQLKKLPEAIDAFRAAVRVEPHRTGPRAQAARLLDLLSTDPQYAELHAKTPVDPAEVRRLRMEEAELLARDAELLPDDVWPRYQRGMLLYLLGDLDGARLALEDACRVAPRDYESWMAYALVCEKQHRWEDAGRAIVALRELQPEAHDWRLVLLRMRDTVLEEEARRAAESPHSESLSAEESIEPAESSAESAPAAQSAPGE
ncbi:MAG TPA: multiheme c-type cytochrome [Lacipirellulaceae bacterium]|nr:multiheme c-type cytochrome [Lacipirellulaceae bacterium]